MMAPQDVFDHCAQMLTRKKLNLVTFNINIWSIQKKLFCFPRLSGVKIESRFSALSFHIFPYNEILKVFKSRI